MIVFECGNGLPFPDRSLESSDARPHYSCSSESVRWRNAAVYPVDLVQTAIAQVVAAEPLYAKLYTLMNTRIISFTVVMLC